MKKIMDNVEVDVEYAAFVWHPERKRYEQIGRPVGNMLLAEGRLQERIRNGFLDGYDTNKVTYKKREVETHTKDWEDITD